MVLYDASTPRSTTTFLWGVRLAELAVSGVFQHCMCRLRRLRRRQFFVIIASARFDAHTPKSVLGLETQNKRKHARKYNPKELFRALRVCFDLVRSYILD